MARSQPADQNHGIPRNTNSDFIKNSSSSENRYAKTAKQYLAGLHTGSLLANLDANGTRTRKKVPAGVVRNFRQKQPKRGVENKKLQKERMELLKRRNGLLSKNSQRKSRIRKTVEKWIEVKETSKRLDGFDR